MRLDRLRSVSRTSVVLFWVAFLYSAGPLVAETQFHCDAEKCIYVVVDQNRITEDGDPLLAWEGFTEELGYPLNPGGATRGDGPLDMILDAFSGVPSAVWSYNIGSSFEVAYTHWSYEGWRPVEFLTANATDDLDPHIAIGDDGTMYVVWWRNDGVSSDIHMSTRDAATGRFGIPYLIAANGRRSSVVVAGDTLIVAFERPLPGVGQEVVVLQQRPGEAPSIDVIATVQRTQPLEVQLVKEGGFVWMHWKHTDRLAGYTEYSEGEWSVAPDTFVGGAPGSGDPTNIELGPGL